MCLLFFDDVALVLGSCPSSSFFLGTAEYIPNYPSFTPLLPSTFFISIPSLIPIPFSSSRIDTSYLIRSTKSFLRSLMILCYSPLHILLSHVRHRSSTFMYRGFEVLQK
jgi:hypothetical protein